MRGGAGKSNRFFLQGPGVRMDRAQAVDLCAACVGIVGRKGRKENSQHNGTFVSRFPVIITALFISAAKALGWPKLARVYS